VVADYKMVVYHGTNLQHYILTLMSIEGPSISFNAQTTLKNFCQWQHSRNSPGGIQHDTAVLVTRQDICRAHDKCDTLGLAELGTICDPYRSCSISEDSGLSTAFTIAHELGHVYVSFLHFHLILSDLKLFFLCINEYPLDLREGKALLES